MGAGSLQVEGVLNKRKAFHMSYETSRRTAKLGQTVFRLILVIATVLVIGSYFLARYRTIWLPQKRGETPAHRPESAPAEVLAGEV